MKNLKESLLAESEKDFIEKGAALEHARWARWQKYVHSKCSSQEHTTDMPHCFCNPDKIAFQNGNMVIAHSKHSPLTIPFELVKQWERQINTPYEQLSEVEKESDRREVREYLPLIRHLLQEERENIRNKVANLNKIPAHRDGKTESFVVDYFDLKIINFKCSILQR